MLLRLLLVGAVTGLGMDLPKQGDLERWSASGRAWWDAQVAALKTLTRDEVPVPTLDELEAEIAEEAPMPAGKDALAAELPHNAVPMPFVTAPSDAEFAGVVEAMVAGFAPAPTPAPEPTPEATVAAAPEPSIPDEDLYPGLAYELNREAEGLSVPAQDSQSVTTPPDARLANAVRLTGQAFQAWVALLQTPAVVSAEH
jgi:hypothetical protein